MRQFTLAEFSEIRETKQYITKERFVYYFSSYFNYDKDSLKKAWEYFSKFPYVIINVDNHADLELLERVLKDALQLYNMLHKNWSSSFENIPYSTKDWRKFVYKDEDGVLNEFVLNMLDATHIIAYAELLKRDITTVALLRSVSEIKLYNSQENTHIWEGDIYDTMDSFYGNKSTVYVVGTSYFSKVLYIKGKGYLIDGEPNYDKSEKYNDYVLRLSECVHIGNIYTNISVLLEGDLVC